jgi:hypothetical protein
MMSAHQTGVFWRLAIVLGAIVLGGCEKSLPPETDPDKGRDALTSTLVAWQSGTTLEDYRKNSSIVAWDPDWEKGERLTSFEIARDHKRNGVDLSLSVKLVLAGKDGKGRERTVNYSIGMGAQTVVLRQIGG